MYNSVHVISTIFLLKLPQPSHLSVEQVFVKLNVYTDFWIALS